MLGEEINQYDEDEIYENMFENDIISPDEIDRMMSIWDFMMSFSDFMKLKIFTPKDFYNSLISTEENSNSVISYIFNSLIKTELKITGYSSTFIKEYRKNSKNWEDVWLDILRELKQFN